MSIVLGKASLGRHFAGLAGGGGGGDGGIISPGIAVELEATEITATPEQAQVDVTVQQDPVTAALQDVAITATPQQSPISVTVIPESIVATVAAVTEPPFPGQAVSVDFDGTEYMRKAKAPFPDTQRLGFANAWSHGVWWRPAAGTSKSQGIAGFGTDVILTRNRGIFRYRTDVAPARLEVECGDNAGLSGKRYNYDSLPTEEFWNFDLATWDGTDLLLYHAGVFVAPTATPLNTAVTMNDTSNREILVGTTPGQPGGQDAIALIHSSGIWGVPMSPAEALALWNGGAGRSLDWAADSGAYVSSADLLHWYRLGLDPADIGKDYGNAAILLNIGDDAVGIDASDIVIDSP